MGTDQFAAVGCPLVTNVWCTQCRDATTIADFSGRIERGNLVLQGRCETCASAVARVIEGPDF
ncbi:hypothetical protein EAH72_33760 [Pseudomonas caspiana]|nr:hypothetical protein EAH72_33760 [Pseudomonas caspiana]